MRRNILSFKNAWMGSCESHAAALLNNSVSVKVCVLAGITLLACLGSYAAEPHLKLGPRVRVSPPLVGYHSLADLSVERDQPNNLVACGYRYSALQNAMIGFVYLSEDGGHTWREALKDDSSLWVTEESCASGPNGRVFFMAESAIVIHGVAPVGVPLQDRGDIHLHSSFDSGKNWALLSKRGWLDHTAMATDESHGPRRGRMYMFGQASSEDTRGYFNQVQVMTTDDGQELHGPVSAPKPSDFRYSGAYASAARVLPNGDAVAAYLTRQAPIANSGAVERQLKTHVEVFASRNGGATLQRIADLGEIQPCLGAMPSLDVSRRDGSIYVAWGTLEGGQCQTILSSSSDQGNTWSPSRRVRVAGNAYVPTIAINDDGILGLFWLEHSQSHCWRFTASPDRGQTFSVPIPVSRCIVISKASDLSDSARDASPIVHRKGAGPGWESEPNATGFSVIAARDGLIPDRTGLAADSSGVFHAVWPESTDQGGALWSATISVGQQSSKTFVKEPERDISQDVALDFANTAFEPTSGMYAVDVTVTNTGTEPISDPIALRVASAYSAFFASVKPITGDNESATDGAFWIFWPRDDAHVLAPGRQTSPRRLAFLLTDPVSKPPMFGDLLSVKVQILSVK